MSGKSFRSYIALFLIVLISPSNAQHQITLKPAIGGYVYNSENSLKVMGDENYFLNYGFEVSYENMDLFGYDIQVDYSYIYSGIDNVLEFVMTEETGPDPIGSFNSDVSLSLHNFDISLKNEISDHFSYGFGPSFSFVNRSYIVEYSDFLDRLASFAVGVNGSLDIKLPLDENANYWYFYSGLKLRYLYGMFYDEGLRDLSDYTQHFVTGNLTIGIGYSF